MVSPSMSVCIWNKLLATTLIWLRCSPNILLLLKQRRERLGNFLAGQVNALQRDHAGSSLGERKG